MATACIALHLPSGPTPADDVGGHLAAAADRLGDELVCAVQLEEVGTGQPATLVAATGRAGEVRELAGGLASERWWARVAGADASLFGDGPGGWLHVVLDAAEPPVPFDDPTVVGVFRDQHAWYLPLLGDRHLACAALFHDGVRAAGALTAFRAATAAEAGWMAARDPWLRVGRGWLLKLPAGVLRAGPAPAGPGTQRVGTFHCAAESDPEPGTAPP